MAFRPKNCGFCKSRDLNFRTLTEPGEPSIEWSFCTDCGAETYDGYHVDCFPTEEEMASGWFKNREDHPMFSPFNNLWHHESVEMFNRKSWKFWSSK